MHHQGRVPVDCIGGNETVPDIGVAIYRSAAGGRTASYSCIFPSAPSRLCVLCVSIAQADRTVTQPAGQRTAITAESLYLANLLLVPGLAFAALGYLFLKRRQTAGALARNHLEQAFAASCWAGLLLVVGSGVMVMIGGVEGMHTWMVVIVYFVSMHGTLVVLGVLGLARALAGKPCRYPLVGWPFESTMVNDE